MTYSVYTRAALVLVGATAIHLLNFAITGGSFRPLDSGWVLSYTHVLATLGYASGLVAGIIGVRRKRPDGRAWLLLAIVSGALLADHVTRFHDLVPKGVLLAVPLVAVMGLLAVRISRRSIHFRRILAGLGLLAVAVGFHLVLRRVAAVTPDGLDRYEAGWWFQLAVGLKESVELAGWLLVAPALLHLAGVGLTLRGVTKTTV